MSLRVEWDGAREDGQSTRPRTGSVSHNTGQQHWVNPGGY